MKNNINAKLLVTNDATQKKKTHYTFTLHTASVSGMSMQHQQKQWLRDDGNKLYKLHCCEILFT